jgi:hypothetical protein
MLIILSPHFGGTHETDPPMTPPRPSKKIAAKRLLAAYVADAAALAPVAVDVAPVAVDVAPVAVDVAPVVPAPLRTSVGNGAHVDVDPSALHPALVILGAVINGIGTTSTRDAATVTPVTVTASDCLALYRRARTLLDAAATVNAPNRIGASPLDRLMFLTRAAERLIFTADRYMPGVRCTRAFSGGYNGTTAAKIRHASVLSAVSSIAADATVPADACDPLIVAYLAAKKTVSRPDGGYFSVNVGTIDR